MEFWTAFDKFFGPLNLIDRLEGFLMALRYGNYSDAKRNGFFGVAAEVAASALGANTVRFALVRGRDHSLSEVSKLLKVYGIPIFGRTHDHKNIYFSVKKRQARWAEYILLNAGVELANPTFDRRNPGYVGRHGPGWMPTPWAEKESSPPPSTDAATTPEPAATAHPPLARLDRWLDKILDF